PREQQLLFSGARALSEPANSRTNPDKLHVRQLIAERSLTGIAKLQSRKFVWSNKAFATMLGYTKKELTGQSTRILYTCDQAYLDFGKTAYPVLQQGQIFRKEIPFQRKDGSLGWYDFSGELLDPVSDESIWSLVDVSERKKIEMRSKVRVVIADDHKQDGVRIAALLRKRPNLEVIGESVDHEAVMRMVEWLHPELVVLDLTSLGLSGLDTLVSIKKGHPAVRVIVLSVQSSEALVHAVLQLGAEGFLIKDMASRQLDQAFDAVMNGDIWVSPAIVMSEAAGHAGSDSSGVSHKLLTPRQRQVLELVAAGVSTKDIGRQLGLSVKTIETFRSQIMHRLHIHSVAGLIKYAIRHAVVRP
ncbi:MAG: LuxR C-terminal-related transcriptional regulator, partial [Betaproteobacteria bacterium]